MPRWVVTDDQAKRHTRPSGPARRILATAAAIAVIGGGGYALVSSLGGSTSTTASGTSSTGQSRPEAGSAAAPAARPTAGGLGSGAKAPAGGLNGGVRNGAVGAPDFGPVEPYGHDGRFTPVRTSTNYSAAQLGPQATATLAQVRSSPAFGGGSGGHSSAGHSSSGPSSASGFSASALARLTGCIGRVAGNQSVLLVDLAQFQGGPAIIIVTAPPGSATGTQVWAVAAGCSSAGADVLAHDRLP